MRTRRTGALEVSVVGVGCNNFGGKVDESGTRRVVDAALAAGINFFDTADIYGGRGNQGRSEEYLGRALKGRRGEAVIATKFGKPMDEQKRGARPEYVRRACDESLRRLGVDHIDLYQIHEPDPSVPIAETLGALNELVRAGKVREIGCSNFSVDELREAETAVRPGEARFVSVQNEYSLFQREPEAGMLAECARQGIAFIPYFPLASGLLTGKYRRGHAAPEGSRLSGGHYESMLSEENLERVEGLIAFAEARGHTLLQLAFAWLLARPQVASVIAGATKPEQVRENAAAAVEWEFSEADLAEIDRVLG